MKQLRSGFFLIEWMVQFILLTTVALISYNLIASWHRTVIQTNRLCNALLPVHIATDIMRSDIHEAKLVEANNDQTLVSIAQEHRLIVWYCKEKKLLRSVRSYDQKEQRWLKPSYGLIAQYITGGRGYVENAAQSIEYVTVNLKSEYQPGNIPLLASLRNGLII